MAGNAYPHIVFAKDETVLPRAELEAVVQELFADDHSAPETSQDALSVVLRRRGDERAYTFTFWYDDEAEGLGDHYADYAAPLRRRRITRCTTMIDFSGDADPEGHQAEAASRITDALAQREGVYVFSELAKRFVGMDYGDDPTVAPTPEPELEPTPTPEQKTTEPAGASPSYEPTGASPSYEPAGTRPDIAGHPAPQASPSQPPVELPAAQSRPEPHPAPAPTPVEPTPSADDQRDESRSEEKDKEKDKDKDRDRDKDKPGLFKRMFGRQGK